MKKIKFLALSIVMILVSTFALSGCTKVSAEEFLNELSANDEYEITTSINSKGTILGVESNITTKIIRNNNNTYFAFTGNNSAGGISSNINIEVYIMKSDEVGFTEVYSKILTDWQYLKIKNIDLEDKLKDLVGIYSSFVIIEINADEILKTAGKTFEEVYIKEDGVWYLKKADGTADKDTMKIYYDKNSLKIEMLKDNIVMSFNANSKKITVSQEALKAKK